MYFDIEGFKQAAFRMPRDMWQDMKVPAKDGTQLVLKPFLVVVALPIFFLFGLLLLPLEALGNIKLEAPERDDGQIEAQLEKAAKLARDGFHLKALSAYKLVHQSQPPRADVITAMVQLYLELDLKDDAARLLAEARAAGLTLPTDGR